MSQRVRSAPVLLLLMGIAACASLKEARVPSGEHGAVETQPRAEGVHYRIDAPSSEVHVLVYRGGPLARLGHNHVMVSRAVSGDVWIAEPIERSSMTLQMPVEALVVDDPEARRSEGPDFPVEVPEDAKQGTRKNMLSPAVLDGAQYKSIVLRSTTISGTSTTPRLTLAVTVKDQTREVNVPASVVYEGDRLVATGEFTIKQTEFGIQPFSVALGAVQVLDELKIKFKVSAVKE